jgi:hypothetical protein
MNEEARVVSLVLIVAMPPILLVATPIIRKAWVAIQAEHEKAIKWKDGEL